MPHDAHLRLDARQLDAFAATIETGSLAAAARELHITLAAVSLRIKALETQLGQRLLVRGKAASGSAAASPGLARATRSGQLLLAHIRRMRLLEAELSESLMPDDAHPWQPLHVAVNADSLASWFLPGVQATVQQHKLLLRCLVDDQEYTLQALHSGEVIGCVTQLAQPVRGCVAQPLGLMRYHCVAAPELARQLQGSGRKTGQRMRLPALLQVPALCFNAKDHLQERFVQQHLGVSGAAYPRHHVPAGDAYHLALLQGLGWGLQADVQLRLQWPQSLASGQLVDVFPQQYLDVPLYWHHWQQESQQAARLTQAVVAAARRELRQMP